MPLSSVSPARAPEPRVRPGVPVLPASAALALLGAVIVVWGANWPIMKIGLDYIPPFTFALFRLLLGAACLFALLLVLGRLRVPGRADLPVVATVSLLQLAAFLAFINLGLERVEAGRAAVLCYTTLIWVTPLAVLFLGERLTAAKAAGVAAGLAGVVVLFNPAGFDWGDRPALIGNGLLLSAALAWALAILHVRAHNFRLTPLQLAPWQMTAACVPLGLLVLVFEGTTPIRWSPALYAVLAFNGPVATAFALWAWISVNRALPAITTALGSLGVPAAGLAFAAAFLGEPVTPTNAAGLALIVLGLGLISLETARRS